MPGQSVIEDGSNDVVGSVVRVLMRGVGLKLCVSLCVLGMLTGCPRVRAPEVSADAARNASCQATTLDAVACDYVDLALALGERDPDSLDFSIAPPVAREAARSRYVGLPQIAEGVHALRGRLTSLHAQSAEQRERAQTLDLQLASIETRITMLRGREYEFDEESAKLFDTMRLPDTERNARREVRAEVARLLPSDRTVRTLQGSLAERYAAFDRRFVVPADRLAAVMRAALATCREHTVKFLPLPQGEAVELTFVSHQPWSAFSRYRGQGHSTIAVNLDLPVTVDGALELACHEGYPGHHVFNTLREQALVTGRQWPEAEVQLTFSPQSYVSEAAASFAPRLAFSPEERMRVERDVLFPLAGLRAKDAELYVRISSLVRELDSAEPAIAREYLDGRLEFVRAEEALAGEVLMAHAEATLLYLNEYRSYMLAYTDGPRRVEALLAGGGKACANVPCTPIETAKRWAAFQQMTREFQVTFPAATP